MQSYLETSTTDIQPWTYSKAKLNLTVTNKNKYDKYKQMRALMPNLIHSLDANSLCSLYCIFSEEYPNAQFFSIHDCFGTTAEKVSLLKNILASVYTDLYSNDPYLIKFDREIIELIQDKTNFKVNDREIILSENNIFLMHDIS